MTDAERAAQRLSHSFENLNRAVNEASNEAIDKAVVELKKLINATNELTDAEKDKVKDIRTAYEALEKATKAQASKLNDLRKIQEKLRSGTLTTVRAHQELANKGIHVASKRLDDLNKAIEDNVTSIERSTQVTKEQIDAQTKAMQKFDVRLKKFSDDSLSHVEKSLIGMATIGSAAKAIGSAASDVYKNLTKLADKGLLSTWVTINTTALKLRMGADELIAVIDKNRDLITSMGGGVKGIEAFATNLEQASSGLEYMGKEGKKVSAQFMSVFSRNGLTVEEYVKNSKRYNDSFKTFQGMFGTTSEEFAEYIDTLQSGAQIQSKVLSGDKSQLAAAQLEIRERIKNAATLGLSTQQLVQMNKTLEQMYQPNKNRQGEVIRARLMRKLSLQATAADAERRGDTDTAARIRAGLGEMDSFERASPQDKLKFKAALDAMSARQAYDTRVRNGDEASFENYVGREAGDKGGLEPYAKIADELKLAELRKLTAQKNRAGAVEGGGGVLNPDGSITPTAVTNAFSGARVVVEQVTSLFDNHFTTAVKAASVSLLALAGSSTVAAATNALRTGGLGGLGGLAKGGLGRVAGAGAALMPGALGVAGAGAAGYAIGSGFNWGFEKLVGDSVGGKLYDSLHGTGAKPNAAPTSGRSLGGTPASRLPASMPSSSISEVLRTGAGFNEVRLGDGRVVRQSGARNWRNNNPGNIEYGDFAKKYGAIGSDGRFAIFPSMDAGRKAKEALIFEGKGYKNLSLTDAISRYAPPSENDTGSYQRNVLASVGGANKRMADYTAEERSRIMDAMQKVEGFKVGKTVDLSPLGAIPGASTASAQASNPAALEAAIRENTSYLSRIAANTSQQQPRRDVSKQDKRDALSQS